MAKKSIDTDEELPLFEIRGMSCTARFPPFATGYSGIHFDNTGARQLSLDTIYGMDRCIGELVRKYAGVSTKEEDACFDLYSNGPAIIRYFFALMFDRNRVDPNESTWFFNDAMMDIGRRVIEGLATDALRGEAEEDKLNSCMVLVELAQKANDAVAHVHQHAPEITKQVAGKERDWPVNMQSRPAEQKEKIAYVRDTGLASKIRKSPLTKGPDYGAPVTSLTRDLLKYIHDFRASQPAVWQRYPDAQIGTPDYCETKFKDAYPFSEELGQMLWNLPALNKERVRVWAAACMAVIEEYKDNIPGYEEILEETGRSEAEQHKRDHPNASSRTLHKRRLKGVGSRVESALVGLINDGFGGK